MIDERGLTLVGMAVANLTDADAVQLRLPFDGGTGVAIDHALDAVRDRFGGSVDRARRAARPTRGAGRCRCSRTVSRLDGPRLAR